MANPWKLLKGLLGEARQEIGTITTDNGDGTFQVNMVGGGSVEVFGGDFSAGQAVFVKSGQIQSVAPSLSVTFNQIEV